MFAVSQIIPHPHTPSQCVLPVLDHPACWCHTGKAVVTTTIRLRLYCRSTAVRL